MLQKINRLEIYGDSIMAGVYCEGDTYAYKLRKGRKFEVMNEIGIAAGNNSIMGSTIIKGFSFMERKLKNCDESTAVLIEFGGNDSDCEWDEVSENPDGNHTSRTSEKVFVETYAKTIDLARERGAQVFMCNLPLIDEDKYFEWITNGKSKENILKWLGCVHHLTEVHEIYEDLVYKIAKEKDVEIVDIRSAITLEDIGYDGIHPTIEGHEKIEKAILEFFKNKQK